MGNGKIILSASDIYRSFKTVEGQVDVLKGATLKIEKGDMAAVMGASGVGKSTLLHILGGLDDPDRGEVTIGDNRLAGRSEQWRAKFRNEKVGFVFQFHYLLEDFNALENVMIPLLVSGTNRDLAKTKAEKLLGKVGLSQRLTHRPYQLSGGEQQRVAVARALVNDPEIVLADEPSGNLDITTGRKLNDLLFDLNSEVGTTFLIATHNQELADKCSCRLDIVDGKIREQS